MSGQHTDLNILSSFATDLKMPVEVHEKSTQPKEPTLPTAESITAADCDDVNPAISITVPHSAALETTDTHVHQSQQHNSGSQPLEKPISARSTGYMLERPGNEHENSESSIQGGHGVAGRSRRSSVSQREPTSLQSCLPKDTLAVNGWKMRTRCFANQVSPSVDIVIVYLYDSSASDVSKNQDADMDVFRCHDTTLHYVSEQK